MSYSGYHRTPPRSALVILGGVLAWIGLWSGAIISVPGYHLALTVGDQPIEMTWEELASGTLPPHGYIRLVDVQLLAEEPVEAFPDFAINDVFFIDPDKELDTTDPVYKPAAVDFLRDESFFDMPVVVAPLSKTIEETPPRIVVPSFDGALSAAYEEVGTSNTLTGVFSMNRFHLDGRDITEGDDAQDVWHYTYLPIDTVNSRTDAMTWFALSFLGIAAGLVICGAGGPSVICCFFFQAPSILSLFGYPLRYGRGNNFTRSLYAFGGICGIVYGYQSLFVQGRFGQVDGVLLYIVGGYLQISIGSAALLGAAVNTACGKLRLSLDATSTKSKPKPRMTYQQACGMKPSDAISTRPYVEPVAGSLSKQASNDPSRPITDSFLAVGFSLPKMMTWKRSKSVAGSSAIQLGCESMVIVETEAAAESGADGGRPRLISILQDGLTIITLPPDAPESKKRFGNAGWYSHADGADIETMLANHLQTTINMAEKRNTAVVAIEESEVVAVCQLAHRVYAAIRTQYGEAHYEVAPARYGRFSFPPQPITVLQTV